MMTKNLNFILTKFGQKFENSNDKIWVALAFFKTEMVRFLKFFNSWRSIVAEDLTSYLVVTSHVTPNDPFSMTVLSISWLRVNLEVRKRKWNICSKIFKSNWANFQKFLYTIKTVINQYLQVVSRDSNHVTCVTCWG